MIRNRAHSCPSLVEAEDKLWTARGAACGRLLARKNYVKSSVQRYDHDTSMNYLPFRNESDSVQLRGEGHATVVGNVFNLRRVGAQLGSSGDPALCKTSDLNGQTVWMDVEL